MATIDIILGAAIASVVTLIFDYKNLRDQRKRLRKTLLTEINQICSDLDWIWDHVQIYHNPTVLRTGEKELRYGYYPKDMEKIIDDWEQQVTEDPESYLRIVRKRVEGVVKDHPLFDKTAPAISILSKEEIDTVNRFYRTLSRFDEETEVGHVVEYNSWISACQFSAEDARSELKDSL